MNSKGIQPRVGMQVTIKWRSGVERKRISGFEHAFGIEYVMFGNGTNGTVYFFKNGNYEIEWIPPTDEERVMFANAAKQLRDRNRQYNLSEEARFIWCEPSLHGDMEFELGESADASLEIASRIAESLALDGMDIDDVSKIEELMR